jgi:hypothetical protein
MSEAATQMVKNVLLSSQVDKIKPFSIGGFTLSPCYYRGLAGFMMLGSPTVVYDYTYSGEAEYRPGSNKLIIGFESIGYNENRGIIIHEATHAVCDMLKIKMIRGDAEAMAYIAQCQFMRANFGDWGLTDPDPIINEIFRKAWILGNMILDGETPSVFDYANLVQTISTHSDYSRAFQMANYKGI